MRIPEFHGRPFPCGTGIPDEADLEGTSAGIALRSDCSSLSGGIHSWHLPATPDGTS